MATKTLLQINSVVNKGSTGRIVAEIDSLAKQNGWDTYIACGRNGGNYQGNLIEIGTKVDSLGHVLKSRLFDLHGFGSVGPTKQLIKEIEIVNPDVIALHNIHGYYINIEILFSFLRRFNKPIFWTLYDCWAFTGHCAYFDMVGCSKWESHCFSCPATNSYPQSWIVDNSKQNYTRKRKIFSNVRNLSLIVHSEWLEKTVNRSFLKEYSIHLVNNGINLEKFKPTPCEDLVEKYNLRSKFVILGIANRWSPRKGLNDFILLSKYLNEDEIILLDGLDGRQKRGLPDNIIGLERAKSVGELAKLYSLGDVFFNPTYEDNFPTTNLEALACGTPVITYNTGGSPEAIDSMTGFVAEKGDLTEVRQAVNVVKVVGKRKFHKECVERAGRLFNYRDRYLDYVLLFEKYLHKHKTI